MSFKYKSLSHQAAEAERRAHFADAAEKWRQALETARAVDVPWIKTRMEFCTNAAARCWGNAQ
ncbi:ANR family transcriptional regulator [Serratia marcescens]|uniref:ANR family transcriptional regulator n=1 Tax=Serratia marcescens TaxID=615 RepID=UPI0028748E6C|nr:ANR family transcriptional regulator [Serratia marcescens]MDS0779558.1 ANR family transcriptional regulator [Serratia marcescens]